MFLQMPIWIALWQALQSTFELRQAPFLWGSPGSSDLSQPDYLIKFDVDVHVLVRLARRRHEPAADPDGRSSSTCRPDPEQPQPAATPEQETQKKMMQWMSTLLFPLFLYNGPSGLNLYILTSTLVGIIESKMIRDHIKQREAAETAAGPVVVDARPTRAARSRQGHPRRPRGPTKAGGSSDSSTPPGEGRRDLQARPRPARRDRQGEVRRVVWWVDRRSRHPVQGGTRISRMGTNRDE